MFEIKTLKDGLKKIAPRTKTKAITDDDNKSLDTILSEKANSTDVPSKVSQLANDTGFITNATLADYPNNTQMNAAINSHHDSTKQDKLAAQTPYTNVGSKNKIPKITTNALGQVTNVEEVDVETPINLSQNLAYANTNDTSIVTNVSDDLLLSDGTTYIEAKKSTGVINNGLLSSVEKAIARFSKDYFSIKNNNEITINNDKVLAVDGSSNLPTYTPILNNINTGIACSYNTQNLPVPNTDTIILCGSVENSIHTQVAFTSEKIFFRISSDGVTWANWVEYYTNKQDKLTFTETDFNVTNNNVSLNSTKFANYLLKSDAPGYADILTNANAKTTYVAKNEASGYADILTKTLASTTYETIENASATYETKQHATSTYETKANASSTYVSKTDAVGYDDILTKTEASGEYETITNASATYETKANVSATYVSKTNAPGYNDILTKTNAKTTYATIASVNAKQDKLVSGTNIKTINNESLLGSGNIKSGSPSNIRSNIAVNVTPTALSSYCAWDTQQLYGYKATVTVNGLTANSLIQNIIMTDTLLASVGYIATTGANSLTFYTQDNTTLSGTIITLITSEVV